jgi:hypothetical protein
MPWSRVRPAVIIADQRSDAVHAGPQRARALLLSLKGRAAAGVGILVLAVERLPINRGSVSASSSATIFVAGVIDCGVMILALFAVFSVP